MQDKELDTLLGKCLRSYTPEQMAGMDWRPTSAMAHAWEVVVCLEPTGFALKKLDGKWDARFSHGAAVEDTAPLAICRAAWRHVKATGAASGLSAR